MNLLSPTNHKLLKGRAVHKDILAVGMHLAPADLAGGKTVCQWSTRECRRLCLNVSGRGQISIPLFMGEDKVKRYEALMKHKIHAARIRKTQYWLNNRNDFIAKLCGEIYRWDRKAKREGKKLAVRLNLTSDVQWEDHIDMYQFPNVQFYDYTKGEDRYLRFQHGLNFPSNYHLTFSRGEHTKLETIAHILKHGGTVAVVFDKPPRVWYTYPVIDGDKHDYRFLDPKGCIVGLTPKGRAKRSEGRFVLR